MAEEPTTLEERVKQLEQEAADSDCSFDLRWKADMRAIKMWQEANPGNDFVWPDHADMVVWLLGELDTLKSEARSVDKELFAQINHTKRLLNFAKYVHNENCTCEGELLCLRCTASRVVDAVLGELQAIKFLTGLDHKLEQETPSVPSE